jgi:hypothetical protein
LCSNNPAARRRCWVSSGAKACCPMPSQTVSRSSRSSGRSGGGYSGDNRNRQRITIYRGPGSDVELGWQPTTRFCPPPLGRMP